MVINWRNCADEMPPHRKNFKLILISDADGKYHILDGMFVNLDPAKEYALMFNEQWTEFTQEKWDYLNQN